jgi:hypothetical protein
MDDQNMDDTEITGPGDIKDLTASPALPVEAGAEEDLYAVPELPSPAKARRPNQKPVLELDWIQALYPALKTTTPAICIVLDPLKPAIRESLNPTMRKTLKPEIRKTTKPAFRMLSTLITWKATIRQRMSLAVSMRLYAI